MKVEIASDVHITKNFTFGELANNQSNDAIKCIFNDDIKLFAEMLQELRDWYKKPMDVNSWYRTKSFNDSLPGASKNSLHLKGLAMDWGVNHTDAQRKNVIAKWRDICSKHNIIGGINLYTHGYHLSVHEELLGNKAFKVRDYRGKKGDW